LGSCNTEVAYVPNRRIDSLFLGLLEKYI